MQPSERFRKEIVGWHPRSSVDHFVIRELEQVIAPGDGAVRLECGNVDCPPFAESLGAHLSVVGDGDAFRS